MNATKLCSIENCESKHYSRGWCQMHYTRWTRYGDPENGRVVFQDPSESFRHRTKWVGECLMWTGAINTNGYGVIVVEGKNMQAHRYAWAKKNGPIPPGMWVDHSTCYEPLCVNEKHLRLATIQQNSSNRAGPLNELRTRNVQKSGQKFRVVIQKNGQRYHFGSHDSLEQAKRVAERAREELFGEYAGRG